MTPFASLVNACGLSLKGAAMLLHVPYDTIKGWSSGKTCGKEGGAFSKIHSSMEKLTELKREIDRIFHNPK